LIENKRILVCPLNWGLGHATRDIPIIRDLIAKNNKLFVAADKQIISLLVEEFPDINYILFPSFNVRYSKNFLILKLFLAIPYILFKIFKEHQQLKQIISDYEIDVVISDNRFGLWNKKVHSIFITHQIMIKLPKSVRWFEKLLYKFNGWFIHKFDECWIPDFSEENNLSGDLSHKYKLPKNAKCIGIKSRFQVPENMPEVKEKMLVILSGPEPHRTILEDKIISQLKNVPIPCLIVQGKPEHEQITKQIYSSVFSISHLNATTLAREILSSKIVICRAGYSTIMDLATLHKKAIIIPTPGQTEQEYLGKYLHEKGLFYCVNQSDLDIKKDIAMFERMYV